MSFLSAAFCGDHFLQIILAFGSLTVVLLVHITASFPPFGKYFV
jgi:hypothetical protein